MQFNKYSKKIFIKFIKIWWVRKFWSLWGDFILASEHVRRGWNASTAFSRSSFSFYKERLFCFGLNRCPGVWTHTQTQRSFDRFLRSSLRGVSMRAAQRGKRGKVRVKKCAEKNAPLCTWSQGWAPVRASAGGMPWGQLGRSSPLRGSGSHWKSWRPWLRCCACCVRVSGFPRRFLIGAFRLLPGFIARCRPPFPFIGQSKGPSFWKLNSSIYINEPSRACWGGGTHPPHPPTTSKSRYTRFSQPTPTVEAFTYLFRVLHTQMCGLEPWSQIFTQKTSFHCLVFRFL